MEAPPASETEAGAPRQPGLGRAVLFWLKLGCISFGGPAGQIAIMHDELVERRGWISEPRFLRALDFCMVLPGPEAQQLATYIGYRLHGVRGGLAAGGLFVLPSFGLLLLLSGLYAQYGTVPEVEGIVAGLGAAVVALIAVALLRIGRRAIRGPAAPVIAAAAFALIVAGVPFPVAVAGGAVAGVVLARSRHAVPPAADDEPPARVDRARRRRRLRRALLLAAVVWVLPLAALVAADGVYGDLAWFFTLTAVVTFGGAYAVLPFVADAAVTRFDWLTAEQMVAGLALGETTPGPLIMVNTFVGYMAGFGVDGHPGGVFGASVATLATFAPSFVFIFAGAPLVERVPRTGVLAHALQGVTAVVIGAIAALAAFVGGEVLFEGDRPDLVAMAMTVAAFVALWRFRLPVVAVVAAAGLAGLVRTLVG